MLKIYPQNQIKNDLAFHNHICRYELKLKYKCTFNNLKVIKMQLFYKYM